MSTLIKKNSPFRAILLPPRSIPAPRLRLPAKSSRDERRRIRSHRALTAKVRFAGPDSDIIPNPPQDTLNLDAYGKPLTYASAKRGPDCLAWAKAEAEEIIRLMLSGTIVHISHTLVPQDRWNSNEIVYYNPDVKKKRKDDGTIQFHVRGTAGGNLLNVPYDVYARTASLDTVKLLMHSVISGNYSWMTIDIADFYLGTPLPAARYEYLRIHADKIRTSIMDQYNLTPLLYNRHVYFEIRKGMYGFPQAGKLNQTQLIRHLSTHGYIQCANTPCLFRHVTRDIMFSLVVEDFGVRYTKQLDADHLIQTLEANAYKLPINARIRQSHSIGSAKSSPYQCPDTSPKCYRDFDPNIYCPGIAQLKHPDATFRRLIPVPRRSYSSTLGYPVRYCWVLLLP
jgi:hypothetical protein